MKNSQMRSTSAFVKPPTAAIAITANVATAAGDGRRAASTTSGRPAIRANAAGEPATQNQYARICAIELRYTASVDRSVPIGS
jgi:hypothetical protein